MAAVDMSVRHVMMCVDPYLLGHGAWVVLYRDNRDLLYINAYNMTVLVGYIRTYVHGVNVLYVCCMCAEP